MKARIDGVDVEVDMSSEGIDRRLRDLDQLFELCMELRKARLVGLSERPREAPGTARVEE